MIINTERDPSLSLYYLGGVLIQILQQEKDIGIDSLFILLKETINKDINVNFFYYSLDWLYMLSLINLNGGMVCICE